MFAIFPFLPKLHFQFPFLLSLLFLSLSLSLWPFICVLSALLPLYKIGIIQCPPTNPLCSGNPSRPPLCIAHVSNYCASVNSDFGNGSFWVEIQQAKRVNWRRWRFTRPDKIIVWGLSFSFFFWKTYELRLQAKQRLSHSYVEILTFLLLCAWWLETHWHSKRISRWGVIPVWTTSKGFSVWCGVFLLAWKPNMLLPLTSGGNPMYKEIIRKRKGKSKRSKSFSQV